MATKKAIDRVTALRVTRIAWGALLILEVCMGLVFGSMAVVSEEIMPEVAQICGVLAWVGLVVVTPFGLWVRGQYFKSGWVGDSVMPGSYMTGMVLVLVLNQAPYVASLTACVFDARLWPWGAPGLVVLVLHVLLWPNGKAMVAHPDAIAKVKKDVEEGA